MTEELKACCAHLVVHYAPLLVDHGAYMMEWRCRDCGHIFYPSIRRDRPASSQNGLVEALENIVEHWQQGGTTMHWVQDLDRAREALAAHRKGE